MTNKPVHRRYTGLDYGAHEQIRTADLTLTKGVLYQLSYMGLALRNYHNSPGEGLDMERVMGIEPTYSAWKAEVLPLNYTRAAKRLIAHQNRFKFSGGGGRITPACGLRPPGRRATRDVRVAALPVEPLIGSPPPPQPMQESLPPTVPRHIAQYNLSWWRGEDSNLRRRSRQIYSLIPLATREPLHEARHSA